MDVAMAVDRASLERADALMVAQEFDQAIDAYQEAWGLMTRTAQGSEFAMSWGGCWLMLSGLTATVRAGKYQDAADMTDFIFQVYGRKENFLVGNPYFHMLVGIIRYEIAPKKRSDAMDSADRKSVV